MIEDTSPPGPVVTLKPHWRVTFFDDFRGKPEAATPRDDFCYDTLKPQCHIWPGASHDCDLTTQGTGPYPPTKANMVAALKTVDADHDFAAMSLDDVKILYGQIIAERMADLDKCTWTLYEMLNWMSTDYAGRWSARFDGTQVEVDARGKGYLLLSATLAPVEASCIFGGSGGDPNCQLHAFQAGELTPGVSYWVDPDPRWPGVYYAPVSGNQCPYGGTFTGVNCTVMGFPPNVLEPRGVSYWADPDPRWPGVYYANQTYACRDNIHYEPTLGFKNLTCPIINGGVMSFAMSNQPHARGVMQYRGRFEAKARIPKGVGAFPATWLMPETGGWPYDGGEIDVMEARDNADEVYQTYHHGKCYDGATKQEIDATDAADCATKGGVTMHLSKGFTTLDRQADEFWKRDHVFAVEWVGDRFDYFINGVKTGTIQVGTQATTGEGHPTSLAVYDASNFPTSPFYWILNHSTWVRPEARAGWAKQTLRIDFIRNLVQCGDDHAEYCPDGGTFDEARGCIDGQRTYPSPCQPVDHGCANGGVAAGSRCRVHTFDPGVLIAGVSYWADADPRWPGVYYAKVSGGCPYGGSGEVNCQLVGLPDDVLETGVTYSVDVNGNPPGIYYTPDFRN
ncbi:MAG: glycoside hydrolase family 16 protein [Deltaproteobacteria bacterium]|nr:glycoside hydrolase family 16 protein [Deltaproteobacteria bacterium]